MGSFQSGKNCIIATLDNIFITHAQKWYNAKLHRQRPSVWPGLHAVDTQHVAVTGILSLGNRSNESNQDAIIGMTKAAADWMCEGSAITSVLTAIKPSHTSEKRLSRLNEMNVTTLLTRQYELRSHALTYSCTTDHAGT